MSRVASPEALANSFLAYLKEENLYEMLPQITQKLSEEVLRNQDITVLSSTSLSAAQEKEITAELTSKWGDHKVVFSVDSSLLSGMIIHFQDNIIDLSGRKSLRDLKQNLATSDE
jgi:ATP synthase F1 delta subunit